MFVHDLLLAYAFIHDSIAKYVSLCLMSVGLCTMRINTINQTISISR
jgi:hypothetical protein